MTRATRDGAYTLGSSRFRMKAGQILPPGAIIEPTPEELAKDAAPEELAKDAAPENKAKGKAPENKAKAKGK